VLIALTSCPSVLARVEVTRAEVLTLTHNTIDLYDNAAPESPILETNMEVMKNIWQHLQPYSVDDIEDDPDDNLDDGLHNEM
jgi:hypothetical protein